VDRAQAVLQRAVARAAGDEARARLGVQLATLALGAGDHQRARAALAETEGPRLPPVLRQERTLLDARALRRAGRAEEAAARFGEAGVAGLPELLEVLAERQDWPGAAGAARALMAARLPPAPEPLDEPQRRLVVQAASLMAMAGEEAALVALREAEAARMAGGPLEEAFALITGASIAGVGDLPRARQELELARALPARLESLRASPPAAR
jgi:hypothetical protein